MKKYLLQPGFVPSSDGQMHYISAPELAKLFGVSLGECVVADEKGMYRVGRKQEDIDRLTWLGPQMNGKYEKVEE